MRHELIFQKLFPSQKLRYIHMSWRSFELQIRRRVVFIQTHWASITADVVEEIVFLEVITLKLSYKQRTYNVGNSWEQQMFVQYQDYWKAKQFIKMVVVTSIDTANRKRSGWFFWDNKQQRIKCLKTTSQNLSRLWLNQLGSWFKSSVLRKFMTKYHKAVNPFQVNT